MRIVAISSIKGGVGKTATAVNLGYVSAASGARTLVWDLDSQAAATFYFRIKPKIKGGSTALIEDKKTLPSMIRGTDFDNLDVVPGDFSHRNLDLVLDGFKRPNARLAKLMRRIRSEYDVAILDCPPGIGVVAESVFGAADVIAVPVIPTTLSVRTFEQLTEFTDERFPSVSVLGFFSMVDRRKRLHREVVSDLNGMGHEVLDTSIPNATVVEKMGLHRAPVATFAPRSAAAAAYRALWDEIRLGLDAE